MSEKKEEVYKIEDEPIVETTETTETDVVDPDNPKTPKKKL